MALAVAKIVFSGSDDIIEFHDQRPASRACAVLGVGHMLRALGIKRGPLNWPLPCLDIKTLHERNAERVRARIKRKVK